MRSLLLALVVLILASTAPAPAQTLQACGQGVVIRVDGSVLIDGWKLFSMFPVAPTLSTAIPPSVPPSINAPIRIVLGANIADETPLCWETAMGGKCVTFKQLRALK